MLAFVAVLFGLFIVVMALMSKPSIPPLYKDEDGKEDELDITIKNTGEGFSAYIGDENYGTGASADKAVDDAITRHRLYSEYEQTKLK